MAVYKRGNGYQVEFSVKGVRYRPPIFKTEAEAEKWEFETRQALKAGQEPPKAPAAQVGGGDAGTIGNALRAAKDKRWSYKRGSSKTVFNAEAFVKWVGEKTLATHALSEDKVHEFVKYLMEERRVSNSTVNRYLSAISVLMEYGRVPRFKLPYQDKKAGRRRFFTEQEVDLVIQTLTLWGKHKERDLFIFLVDTGARPYSEATPLRWDQIDGRKVTFGIHRPTKTNTVRTVPLTTRAYEAIERRRAEMKDDEGPFVDISEWRMVEVWRNIRSHLPQLNDTMIYTARHTCASWQVIKGIDLLRVMRWMGHTSYQTTLGYAHLAPDHLMDNLTALEGGSMPKLMVINGSPTKSHKD